MIVESLLPPLLPLWAPTAIGVRVCQVVNDAVAADAARFPGRMVAMGIVPFQDGGEAVRELDRIVEQHGMKSVLIPASHAGKNLDEAEFFPFFERAQEHGVLVLVHPHEVAAEKIALTYTSAIVWNSEIADDALWAKLHRHFSNPELVELGFFIGLTLGQQRWIKTLGIEHGAVLGDTQTGLAPAK